MKEFLCSFKFSFKLSIILLIMMTLLSCGNKVRVYNSENQFTQTESDSSPTSNSPENEESEVATENIPPSVILTGSIEGEKINSPFLVTITFSEEISNFDLNDFTVTNATIDNLIQLDNKTYTLAVTPHSSGTVTIVLAEKSYTDLEGIENTASSSYSITYDADAPSTPTTTNNKDFHDSFSVTLSNSGETDFSQFRYTTDGNDPTSCSNGTTATTETQISISSTTTLKAISCDSLGNASGVMTRSYTYYPGWTLEIQTTGSSESITLVFVNPSNLTVNWGDATSEDVVTWSGSNTLSHTYTNAGTYQMYLNGEVSQIRFDQPDTQPRLKKVISPVLGITGLTSLSYVFYGTSISPPLPNDLFKEATNVTSFSYAFRNCTDLTGSIPEDLFKYNVNVTTFRGAFRSSGFTSIPANLFANNTEVKYFDWTFYGNTGLTAIPAGLFANNSKVESFEGTFEYTGITSIPEGLFDNTPLVVSFYSTFRDTNITSIPANLFANTTLVDFYGFDDTFRGSSSVTGNVPQLWLDFPGANGFNCFRDLTSADNYGDIPSDWR